MTKEILEEKIRGLAEKIETRDDICADLAYIRAWAETIEDTFSRHEAIANECNNKNT